MPHIRPYQMGDKAAVQRICIATAPAAATADEKAITSLLATYCDYYVEQEAEHCFVLADDNDCAVGYILCAADYGRYRRLFAKQYLPRTKNCGFAKRMECRGAMVLPRFFQKKYPAHLHIDILDAYQRQGYGSQLMDALTGHLRAIGIPAVMLVVGKENEKGRNFYKKYGFREEWVLSAGVVMGLVL